MSDWQEDKRWSDRFLPEIKRILGEHLIGEAPVEEDQERNTDLIVLHMEPLRIGCRVRRNEYLARYGDEFTIRANRPSGQKTELTKIIEGWGDFLLYGIADAANQYLAKWTLIELKAFRLWFARHMASHGGEMPGKQLANGDGSSMFRAFRMADVPANLIYCQNTASVPQEAAALKCLRGVSTSRFDGEAIHADG